MRAVSIRRGLGAFAVLAMLAVSHGHLLGHGHGHNSMEPASGSDHSVDARLDSLEQSISAIMDKLEVVRPPVFENGPTKSESGHGHGHSHGHVHGEDRESYMAWLAQVFAFSALQNAYIAVVLITALTSGLIWASPVPRGRVLAFLVAFAEGGMLGNVFLHLVPEVYAHGNTVESSLVLLGGFLAFCALDKTLRIVALGYGHTHGHSHSHSHSHSPTDATSQKTSNTPKTPEKTEPVKSGADSAGPETSRSTILALLNVAADFLHNITDGVALAAAFSEGPTRGTTAFVLMVLHEVPHQFGDFSLLVNGGMSKSTGMRAQLTTSLGTFLGCTVFGMLKHTASSDAAIGRVIELITPFTAGVFLFISTVGILPELLETDNSLPLQRLITESLAQVSGVLAGLAAMVFMID